MGPAPISAETLCWEIGELDAGERLDRWIAEESDDLSRSQVSRAVAEGRVRLGGQPVKKAGVKLRAGDRLELILEPAAPSTLVAQPMDLAIVFEDEHLLVVDKPAGLVVHPAPGHPDGTLVNGLLAHLRAAGGALPGRDPVRPGLVHRLDRDTSGLIAAAKDEATQRALQEQFAARTVSRRYLAVAFGPRLDEGGSFETFYGRHPRDRKKMTGRLRTGRRARTHFRVVCRGEALIALILRLDTGRTHQIRVHLSEAGHPVVADPVYGRPAPRTGGVGAIARELAAARRMERLALHAATLGFRHPITGTELRWLAPPPEDLSRLLDGAFGEGATTALVDQLATV